MRARLQDTKQGMTKLFELATSIYNTLLPLFPPSFFFFSYLSFFSFLFFFSCLTYFVVVNIEPDLIAEQVPKILQIWYSATLKTKDLGTRINEAKSMWVAGREEGKQNRERERRRREG